MPPSPPPSSFYKTTFLLLLPSTLLFYALMTLYLLKTPLRPHKNDLLDLKPFWTKADASRLLESLEGEGEWLRGFYGLDSVFPGVYCSMLGVGAALFLSE